MNRLITTLTLVTACGFGAAQAAEPGAKEEKSAGVLPATTLLT